MATQSPFSLLEEFLQKLSTSFQPPDWAVHETQRRIVLLLNHVLMQEPEAMARLIRQKGQTVMVNWRSVHLKLMVTPAGLLDLAEAQAAPDLTLAVTEESAVALVRRLFVETSQPCALRATFSWLPKSTGWLITFAGIWKRICQKLSVMRPPMPRRKRFGVWLRH